MREIAWFRGALKAFEKFPAPVREDMVAALYRAAAGGLAKSAKPLRKLGNGVYQVAASHRGNTYRARYDVRIDTAIWVIHAFQKKSVSGIATPKRDIDVVIERRKRLKESLK